MRNAARYAALASLLDQAAERLTARVLAEMYRDPFWYARFGERAERRGREDGRFHIDYLMQALIADDATVMANYARWLQQVLTSRGMCTRHIAENFERLGVAIADERWTDGHVAIAMLDAAIAALRYDRGAAGDVHERMSRIVADAMAAYTSRHPDAPAGAPEFAELVSYAADALALGAPHVFVDHVCWLAGFLEQRGEERAVLVARLEGLLAASRGDLASLMREAIDALGSSATRG